MRCFIILILILVSFSGFSSDSIPAKTVYSINFAILNTSRWFDTHIHNRYSYLDFRTDDRSRSASGAVGVNVLHQFNPRYRFETGIFLSFNHYKNYQYNLVYFVETQDTFYKYYDDEERLFRLSRFTAPLKVLYHLSPRTFPWYCTGGITVNRMLFDVTPIHHSTNTPQGIELIDGYGNSIKYHKYQFDYIAGIGKLVRLGPALQFRFEGGYAGSIFSVLKKPDRGWLSAYYLQFGLISN